MQLRDYAIRAKKFRAPLRGLAMLGITSIFPLTAIAYDCEERTQPQQLLKALKTDVHNDATGVLACADQVSLENPAGWLASDRLSLSIIRSKALLTLSRWDEAEAVARRLMNSISDSEDHTSNAELHRILGVSSALQGKHSDAIDHFQTMLEAANKSENKDLIIAATHNLGTSYMVLGDYPFALSSFQLVLAKLTPEGNPRMLAVAYGSIGTTFSWLSRPTQAIDAYKSGLEFAQKAGYSGAALWNNLSLQYVDTGEYDLASAALDNAWKDAGERKNDLARAHTLHGRGVLSLAQGQAIAAENFLRKSLALKTKLKAGGIGPTNRLLAEALFKQNKLDAAERSATLAIQQIEAEQAFNEASEAYLQLAEIWQAMGNPKAWDMLKNSLDVQDQLHGARLDQQLSDLLRLEKFTQQHAQIATLTLETELQERGLEDARRTHFQSIVLSLVLLAFLLLTSYFYWIKRRSNGRLRVLNNKLESAASKIKVLGGLLPICCNCKKIRDDDGFWSEVEVYVREHTDADFTHGYCPSCSREMMDELENLRAV